MSALEQADAEAAAVAKAPRVTLKDIEAAVRERYDLNAWDAVAATEGVKINTALVEVHPLRTLSMCVLVMKNGFTVIGKSAPASPDNFDRDLGRKLAYEDCVRQLWPLMGFQLRTELQRDKEAEGALKSTTGE